MEFLKCPSSSPRSQSTNPSIHFLGLPENVRKLIYTYLLTPLRSWEPPADPSSEILWAPTTFIQIGNELQFRRRLHTAILAVCRSIRKEALPIFYSSNWFSHFQRGGNVRQITQSRLVFQKWLNTLLREPGFLVQHLRVLQVEMVVNAKLWWVEPDEAADTPPKCSPAPVAVCVSMTYDLSETRLCVAMKASPLDNTDTEGWPTLRPVVKVLTNKMTSIMESYASGPTHVWNGVLLAQFANSFLRLQAETWHIQLVHLCGFTVFVMLNRAAEGDGESLRGDFHQGFIPPESWRFESY